MAGGSGLRVQVVANRNRVRQHGGCSKGGLSGRKVPVPTVPDLPFVPNVHLVQYAFQQLDEKQVALYVELPLASAGVGSSRPNPSDCKGWLHTLTLGGAQVVPRQRRMCLPFSARSCRIGLRKAMISAQATSGWRRFKSGESRADASPMTRTCGRRRLRPRRIYEARPRREIVRSTCDGIGSIANVFEVQRLMPHKAVAIPRECHSAEEAEEPDS